MNILFISTKSPLPTNDGHCLRTYNLLKQISKHHKIYLLSFVKYQEEYDHVVELKKHCQSVELLPIKENLSKLSNIFSAVKNIFSSKPFVVQKYDTREMRASIQSVLLHEQIDMVHLDMLPLYCYRDLFCNIPTFLNQHNIESALLVRRVEAESMPLSKFYILVQQKRLEKFEKEAMNGVDCTAVCSIQDMQLAQQYAPKAKVVVISNGVDLDFFQPTGFFDEEPNSLVFVGGLNWYPNRDGMKWFDREILPKIVTVRPGIKVHLLGRSEKNNWIHPEHFIEHGFVDDIRPYLEKAAVFIVPLRVGGGTRLKILDAMAMKKAIVSTTIGAEGLGATDGRDLLLADLASLFAYKIVELLDDAELRFNLKERARCFVLDSYQWERIGKILCQVYKDL